jgi:hypothetical protein
MNKYVKVASITVIGVALYALIQIITGTPLDQAIKSALTVGVSVLVVGTVATFFYRK